MKTRLPRLYPIVDAELLASRGLLLEEFARELHAAGIRFLQYRDKAGSDAEVLEAARLLRAIFPKGEAVLILNDRVHLCAAAGADGVHLGQRDISVARARGVLGPDALIGLSTHDPEQVVFADKSPADYLAIGPVHATLSKEKPDPVVGLEGVRAARRLTGKPLVAIGGITRESAGTVLAAGADAVAVISALLSRDGLTTAEIVRDFPVNFR